MPIFTHSFQLRNFVPLSVTRGSTNFDKYDRFPKTTLNIYNMFSMMKWGFVKYNSCVHFDDVCRLPRPTRPLWICLPLNRCTNKLCMYLWNFNAANFNFLKILLMKLWKDTLTYSFTNFIISSKINIWISEFDILLELQIRAVQTKECNDRMNLNTNERMQCNCNWALASRSFHQETWIR